MTGFIQSPDFGQGTDFKSKQTTKQLNNFIWTNRKVETKLYLLPIGPNEFVWLFRFLVVLRIRSLNNSLL